MNNEEMLTGLYEGDGSFVARYNKDRAGQLYFYPQVLLGMKDKELLDWVGDYFGGGYLYPAEHARSCWDLRYHGQTRCRPLLEMFSSYVVSERSCGRLNEVLSKTRIRSDRWCTECMPLAVTHAPTLDWLVGFWYADGSVVVNSAFRARPPIRLSVYQANREVLDRIAENFGGGVSKEKSDGSYWSWSMYSTAAFGLACYIQDNFPVATEKIDRLAMYIDKVKR